MRYKSLNVKSWNKKCSFFAHFCDKTVRTGTIFLALDKDTLDRKTAYISHKTKEPPIQAVPCVMGLSEINSKNYDIILDKVKYTPMTPVSDSPMPEYPDNAYNIKTEIKQQQKHLSNNEVLEIISKYKAGKSTYELAQEYGCHRRTISDNLKKQGIKVTNQLMERKGVVELVMQMYSEYYKPDDIAKAVGINVDSVRKILKENNVYIRKSWEYPRK